MEQSTFKLTSSAFKEGEMIPKKYTGQGTDVNPPLQWEGAPANVKSFALICDDPDAPGGNWTHWLVKNIPADSTEIKENSIPGVEVNTSWGSKEWKGPMPPSGTHHYYFKLYAMNKDKMTAKKLEDFYKEVENSKIGEAAVLMGLYAKTKK